jgi:hypothetical protein
MKKEKYPNQGHVVPDFYINGISRSYFDHGNLVFVVESSTGLESHDSIYRNEIARLIIPTELAKKFLDDVDLSVSELIPSGQIQKKHQEEVILVAEEDRLGAPFDVSEG